MARRVRTQYRKIKKKNPQLYEALDAGSDMTTNRQYNYLKKHKIKPLVSRDELSDMVSSAKKKNKVKMRITKDMTIGHRHADGVAIKDGKNLEVRIHPYVQYQGKRYAKDVINHELDHIKVFKKQINRREK
jgi:hypothetical protein